MQPIRKSSRTVINNLAAPLAGGIGGRRPETVTATRTGHALTVSGIRCFQKERAPHTLARSYLQRGEGGLFLHFTHRKLVLPVPFRAPDRLVQSGRAVGSFTTIQGVS